MQALLQRQAATPQAHSTPTATSGAAQLLASLSPATMVHSDRTLAFGPLTQEVQLKSPNQPGRGSAAASSGQRGAQDDAPGAPPFPGFSVGAPLVDMGVPAPEAHATGAGSDSPPLPTRSRSSVRGVRAPDVDRPVSAASPGSATPLFAAQETPTLRELPASGPTGSRGAVDGEQVMAPTQRLSSMQLLASQALCAAQLSSPGNLGSLHETPHTGGSPDLHKQHTGEDAVAAEVLQSSQNVWATPGNEATFLEDWEADAVQQALATSTSSAPCTAEQQAGAVAMAAARAVAAQYAEEAAAVLAAAEEDSGRDDQSQESGEWPDDRQIMQPEAQGSLRPSPGSAAGGAEDACAMNAEDACAMDASEDDDARVPRARGAGSPSKQDTSNGGEGERDDDTSEKPAVHSGAGWPSALQGTQPSARNTPKAVPGTCAHWSVNCRSVLLTCTA